MANHGVSVFLALTITAIIIIGMANMASSRKNAEEDRMLLAESKIEEVTSGLQATTNIIETITEKYGNTDDVLSQRIGSVEERIQIFIDDITRIEEAGNYSAVVPEKVFNPMAECILVSGKVDDSFMMECTRT